MSMGTKPPSSTTEDFLREDTPNTTRSLLAEDTAILVRAHSDTETQDQLAHRSNTNADHRRCGGAWIMKKHT